MKEEDIVLYKNTDKLAEKIKETMDNIREKDINTWKGVVEICREKE